MSTAGSIGNGGARCSQRAIAALNLAALLFAASAALAAPSAPSAPTRLWPGTPPGEMQTLPPETDFFKNPPDPLIAGKPIIRLGNVSDPTITIYPADPAKNTGAAVVVAPGGGYYILAMDLEGTEVCEWLNSIGVTAVLLKYRVPSRPDRPRFGAALDDAMRAMGIVRHRAAELGVDPKRIGMLGFSAGAHLSAATATASALPRTYVPVDRADAVNCRPDFIVLIYPGGFVDAENHDALRPEVVPIAGHSPPVFIAQAEDDTARVENSLQYYKALRAAGVPAEMHLYPTGGHGYGLRRNGHLVTTWPDRVADWMESNGWLKPSP